MLKEIRQQSILAIVQDKKFVTTNALAEHLKVSPSTIRRDLTEMAALGTVLRNRGGVVPVVTKHTEASVHFRASVNAQAKAAIAKRAAELIPDGSVIFLDPSSTVLSMIEYLHAKKNITVVTNSLLLISMLRGTQIKFRLIGGWFYEPSHAFYGEIAEESVRRFNFDMAFLSSVSITPEGYAAETHEHAATIRRAVIKHTHCSVLLCDSSKIDIYRAYNVAHIDELSYIITNDAVRLNDTRAIVIRV